MMNMLIAIMGNIFEENKKVSSSLLLKGKLKFVIDNWWMNAIGEDRKRIQFIIAALHYEQNDEEVEVAKELERDFEQLKIGQRTAFDNILGQLKSIKGIQSSI